MRAMMRRERIIELVGVCWRRSAFVVVALVRGSSAHKKVWQRKPSGPDPGFTSGIVNVPGARRTLG